jgi:hypothetical protein
MKRLLAIGVALVSAAATAQVSTCKEPEYAFLSGATKPELSDEYCYMSRKAASNDRARENVKVGIKEKHELRLDTSLEQSQTADLSRATMACKIAANAIEAALSRRFKSRPPSCR